MTIRRRTTNVFINGHLANVRDIRTDHDVDQPIATGSIVVKAPLRSFMRLGVPIRIEAGYDGQTEVIFDGRLSSTAASFGDSGGEVRIPIEGHGKLLWYAEHTDLAFTGMQSLKTVFNSICARRKVPLYYADNTLYPNGGTLNYGGNSRVNNGNITIRKNSSPGSAIDRWARHYGYRAYDTPIGYHRLKKISGLPLDAPFRDYIQGVNLFDVEQTQTLEGMVNWWDIYGAKFVNADGSETVLHAFAAEVKRDSRLGPSGINRESITDEDLVNLARCDYVRNVQEIDRSTPYYRWAWTVQGDPELSPGHVVSVTSRAVGSNTALWVMRVSHQITDRGWTTSLEGWAGAGQPLPAGDDCVTQTLLSSSGRHLGNEYLSHYRRPNPDGTVVKIPFSVAEDYSTLTIRGYGHGTNSFVANAESTASRFEIWQPHDTTRAVASGEMPRLNENLEKRLNYSLDSTWERLVIPLTGSLRAGSAELRIIAGEDRTVGDIDDFEVRSLTITTCGVGVPVIIS